MSVTYRDQVNGGERLKVMLPNGCGGFVYLARGWHGPGDDAIVFECHEGFAGGVTEAICAPGSDYLDEHFMDGATVVRVDS